jgi:hypothetical protein
MTLRSRTSRAPRRHLIPHLCRPIQSLYTGATIPLQYDGVRLRLYGVPQPRRAAGTLSRSMATLIGSHESLMDAVKNSNALHCHILCRAKSELQSCRRPALSLSANAAGSTT